ncbi:dehydrogenase/reductase SDR family member 4 [Pristis pectinata]|uniref:dehydrogenase/reductase SDR family member 4 n=1 Tax=Pristis pectinata TaxID=685728 RepID=UPI00223D3AC8|nr:dehydrogenase/reductase SDR family member 4 [Pristis pectinata]
MSTCHQKGGRRREGHEAPEAAASEVIAVAARRFGRRDPRTHRGGEAEETDPRPISAPVRPKYGSPCSLAREWRRIRHLIDVKWTNENAGMNARQDEHSPQPMGRGRGDGAGNQMQTTQWCRGRSYIRIKAAAPVPARPPSSAHWPLPSIRTAHSVHHVGPVARWLPRPTRHGHVTGLSRRSRQGTSLDAATIWDGRVGPRRLAIGGGAVGHPVGGGASGLPPHYWRSVGLAAWPLAAAPSETGTGRLFGLAAFPLAAVRRRRHLTGQLSRSTRTMLAGKAAVVTASSQGIGLAVARRLARDGARVLISSRKRENVERAVSRLRAEELPVWGTVCHVGRGAEREALVAEAVGLFGGLDILVSNAAVNPFAGRTLDCPDSAWDKIFEVNVKAAALLVQLAVPHMERRGGGSIVLVGSVAGYRPLPPIGPYSVSKTALLGLTKALATELAPLHIRVNCLAPGFIRTRFSAGLWEDEGCRRRLEKVIDMRRLGEPEECAGTVSFLCSPDAAYITGETINVNGGIHCRL